MANEMKMVPEFTQDDVQTEPEEVKQAAVEETAESEKETPTEPPADTEPVAQESDVDTNELSKAVQGLQKERVELLKEISELRGQRREIKQVELQKVEAQIDELKDVHPEDVVVIDKILRSKGYVTKDEANKMFYESVKQEELAKFLEKYPEYKPENDRNDLNWISLQREISYYRMPENPHQINEILERAHRAVAKPVSDRSIPVKRRQMEVAGVGAGGTQRSSSSKSLDADKREALIRGGWSDDEIKQIEANL